MDHRLRRHRAVAAAAEDFANATMTAADFVRAGRAASAVTVAVIAMAAADAAASVVATVIVAIEEVRELVPRLVRMRASSMRSTWSYCGCEI